MQTIVHYSLHLLVPILIAYFWSKTNWQKNYLILLSTMLVDLDHLLADPIFDPNRCSINFHLLHTYPAIGAYFIGLLFAKNKMIKLICLGLCFHMFTDALDWFWTSFF